MKLLSFDQIVKLLKIVRSKAYLKFSFFLISTGALLLTPSIADVLLFVFKSIFENVQNEGVPSSQSGPEISFYVALMLIILGIGNFYYWFRKEQIPKIDRDRILQNWSIEAMWANAKRLSKDVDNAFTDDIFNAINLLTLTPDIYSNSMEVFFKKFGEDYILLFEQLNQNDYKVIWNGKEEKAKDLLFQRSVSFYEKLKLLQTSNKNGSAK